MSTFKNLIKKYILNFHGVVLAQFHLDVALEFWPVICIKLQIIISLIQSTHISNILHDSFVLSKPSLLIFLTVPFSQINAPTWLSKVYRVGSTGLVIHLVKAVIGSDDDLSVRCFANIHVLCCLFQFRLVKSNLKCNANANHIYIVTFTKFSQ